MGNRDEPVRHSSATQLLHFAFALKAEIEAALAELGIGLADHEALINLRFTDGAFRMTDIADRLVLSKGGITKLVDRLEAAGYVRRIPSPEDRRVTMVEITKEGIGVVDRSRSIIDLILDERWGSRISVDDAELVLRVIGSVYNDDESRYTTQ